MSLSAQIKFPRVLQFSTEDEIYLTRSGTGAPDNTVSQVFYMGAVDTSLQVLSGYTAGLTAQGCNINPAGTAFEADGEYHYGVSGHNINFLADFINDQLQKYFLEKFMGIELIRIPYYTFGARRFEKLLEIIQDKI